jgi:hypothetical protein
MNARTLRTFLPLLAAVALSIPAAAEAQTRRATASRSSDGQDGALHLGLLIGPEFASGDTGIALRGDISTALTHLAPNLRLDGVLSLGYTHFSFGPRDFDATANIVRLVPAARFLIPVAPAVTLYGDAGLGLYFGSLSFGNRFNRSSDNLVGLNMRFAGGALFDVSPTVRLGAELGVNPYFGDFDDTTTTLMFAAQFRL